MTMVGPSRSRRGSVSATGDPVTEPAVLSGEGAPGDGDVTSGVGFDAGTYTLSESTGPAGYSASDWVCDGGTYAKDDVTGVETIEVGLGDDVTCTITNDDVAPSLTLVKDVVNDNGGTAVAADWTLTAAGYLVDGSRRLGTMCCRSRRVLRVFADVVDV